MSSSPRRRRLHQRKGNTLTFGLGAVAVIAALSLAGWWTFGGIGGDDTPEFLTTTVSQGPYDFVVIEQGTVESARNTELRCQVRSRAAAAAAAATEAAAVWAAAARRFST